MVLRERLPEHQPVVPASAGPFPLDAPDPFRRTSAISIRQANGHPELLTPKQALLNDEVLATDARYAMLVGGTRSGKTILICRAIILRALKVKSRHAIFRHRFNACRTTIGLDTLPKTFGLFFPEIRYEVDKTDWYFKLPNGSEIWIGGLDEKSRVEKVLGSEYSTVYLNECSQIGLNEADLVLTRLAENVGLKQRAYFDLNPGGDRHWTNLKFRLKLDPVANRPLKDPENYVFGEINPEDNAQNLDPEQLAALRNASEKVKQRFYFGKYSAETDDSLWSFQLLARCRVLPSEVPQLKRIAIAIDPSGAKSDDDFTHDPIGICVAGLGIDNNAYVLADKTILAGPKAWAAAGISAYHVYKADMIYGEINFGGAMVEATLRAVDSKIPFTQITASRGKHLRAEPVAALYQQGLVHHVEAVEGEFYGDDFSDLEAELQDMTPLGYVGERSPNRADALVHVITALLLGQDFSGFLGYYRDRAEGKPIQTDAVPVKSAAEAFRPLFNQAVPGAPRPPDRFVSATLVAPTPYWATFVSGSGGTSQRYTADENGLIEVKVEGHVAYLLKSGCKLKEEV